MFKMPDPKDFTPNEPAFLVNQSEVLSFFNQTCEGNNKTRIDDRVRKFFSRKALDAGWSEAIFYGNQCLLLAVIKIAQPKATI